MANKADLLQLIRQNCQECMGGPRTHEDVWPVINPSDIAECMAQDCAWYPYRFGNDPVKNPQRVEAGKRLAQLYGFGQGTA